MKKETNRSFQSLAFGASVVGAVVGSTELIRRLTGATGATTGEQALLSMLGVLVGGVLAPALIYALAPSVGFTPTTTFGVTLFLAFGGMVIGLMSGVVLNGGGRGWPGTVGAILGASGFVMLANMREPLSKPQARSDSGGWIRKLAAVSSLKAGCLAAIVGAIVVSVWAVGKGMSDPGSPMVFSSPFFFVGGALAVLILRGVVALVDRRNGPRPPARL